MSEDAGHGVCGTKRYRVAGLGAGRSSITARVSRCVPCRPVTPITPHDRPCGVHCQHRCSGGTRTTLVETEQNKCEIFDSYGLPLHVYTNPELHQWWSQWKYLTHSDIALQAMDSQTCGHYALFFLKARAQGQTYQEFLGRWSGDNLVLNDHKVAEQLKRVIKRELQDEVDAHSDGQKNMSRQALMLCNHCDHYVK